MSLNKLALAQTQQFNERKTKNLPVPSKPPSNKKFGNKLRRTTGQRFANDSSIEKEYIKEDSVNLSRVSKDSRRSSLKNSRVSVDRKIVNFQEEQKKKEKARKKRKEEINKKHLERKLQQAKEADQEVTPNLKRLKNY